MGLNIIWLALLVIFEENIELNLLATEMFTYIFINCSSSSF